jgi:hypothetical protein
LRSSQTRRWRRGRSSDEFALSQACSLNRLHSCSDTNPVQPMIFYWDFSSNHSVAVVALDPEEAMRIVAACGFDYGPPNRAVRLAPIQPRWEERRAA